MVFLRSVPATVKVPRSYSMSDSRGFEQVGRDLLALRDDLVDRLHDRRAADRDRARAVGAHAEEDAPGVAVDDVHVLDRHAEPVGDDLRERGLVSLAVGVRAGEHRHRSRGMHADLAGLEQPGARAERARDVGGRDAAGLDVGRVAQPAQLAAPLGVLAARLEAGDVRDLQRLGERRLVVAGVVEQRDRRLVGELLDEIAPADLGRVDLQLARGGFDEALDDVGGFRPARAAVRVHRRGVGEDRGDLAVDHRRRVLPREQRGVEDGRDAGGEGGEIGAHVRGGRDAHREELAVLVERQLRLRHVVAAVRVREEGLGALRGPLDRAVQLLRRPGDDGLLGVEVDLGAEAAADVGRDHAHLVLGQPQHERRHEQALDVRVLVRDVERVGIVGARVARDRGARLDGVGDEAVVDEFERRDVVRAGESLVHGALVADRPHVAGVVGRAVVHDRRAGLARVGGLHDRGQDFVVDVDQLGRIAAPDGASRR